MIVSRIIALLLAVVSYFLAWFFLLESTEDQLIFPAYLAFCLLLIWQGDYIGGLTGTHFGDLISPRITKAPPGSVIRMAGWCFLFVPLLFMLAKLFFF